MSSCWRGTFAASSPLQDCFEVPRPAAARSGLPTPPLIAPEPAPSNPATISPQDHSDDRESIRPRIPPPRDIPRDPDPAGAMDCIAGPDDLQYIQYDHAMEDRHLPEIRSLISKDLSEPYSIYVYRYFLYHWSELCFLALNPADSTVLGVIICKVDIHSSNSPPTRRGYIAMLAVASAHRGKGIATALVLRAVDAMTQQRADEIVLETEETNIPAMRLYERLGFLRYKKLHRYYLNGNSAYRLVLLLEPPDTECGEEWAAVG